MFGTPLGNPMQRIGAPAIAGAGGIQPPPVNVGVKFPVPPLFPDVMPQDAATSGLGMNTMSFQNLGSRIARAQVPQTTYGFSSGNPGQLASNAATPYDNSTASLLEQALQQQMGGM